jgi:hypothetical protein
MRVFRDVDIHLSYLSHLVCYYYRYPSSDPSWRSIEVLDAFSCFDAKSRILGASSTLDKSCLPKACRCISGYIPSSCHDISQPYENHIVQYISTCRFINSYISFLLRTSHAKHLSIDQESWRSAWAAGPMVIKFPQTSERMRGHFTRRSKKRDTFATDGVKLDFCSWILCTIYFPRVKMPSEWS